MMKLFKGTFRFMKTGFLVPFVFFLVLEFVASQYDGESQLWNPSANKSTGLACHWSNRSRCGSVGHNAPPKVGLNGGTGPGAPSRPPQPSPLAPQPSAPKSPLLPTVTALTPNRKKIGDKHLAYILTSILAGLLVISFVFILIFRHKRSKAVKPLEAGSNKQLQTSLSDCNAGVQLLKQSELDSACESFSNIVGLTSDGPLYKGTLSSGIEISVTSIKLDKVFCRLPEAQFRKKITILSKLNHKNFVNLLGYCEDEPLARMFVFEYAPNGTLFEHLHARESVGLGWAARMRIAMGVAYCLDHMCQLNPPIILKNLDTSLIYLTDDYAAKIADFELCSGTAEGGTVVGSSMAHLQEVPRKGSIVQKFGIVLLELLSGRDPRSEHSGPAEIWAWDLLKVDTPLKDMMDPEVKSFPEDRAAAVFHLIKQCLNPNPEQMLSMNEVTAQLKEITGISPKSAAPIGYDLEILSEGTTF